jgi:hypothetical protein
MCVCSVEHSPVRVLCQTGFVFHAKCCTLRGVGFHIETHPEFSNCMSVSVAS